MDQKEKQVTGRKERLCYLVTGYATVFLYYREGPFRRD